MLGTRNHYHPQTERSSTLRTRQRRPEAHSVGYELDEPTGVVTLEDYSPYIVYGGADWSVDHAGQYANP